MKKEYVWLALIFLIVLDVRLYLSFKTENLSSDESYFHLREVESIMKTGKPFFYDELSFGGRSRVFSPVFHYLIAFSALASSLNIAVKILPNLIASLLVIIIYSISYKITKNDESALFGAFISGFIPVLLEQTTNILSPVILIILILFLMIRLSLSLENKICAYAFLAVAIIASFIHPLILLFSIGALLYLGIAKLEKINLGRKETEIIVFSVFFVLWAQFILYKKLFIMHGPWVIWQNIPPGLLSSHFSRMTVLQGVYEIGLIPFFLGIYSMFKHLFAERRKEEYLIISFAITAGIMLLLKLIELKIGLILFGLLLSILFASWFRNLMDYIRKTKFEGFEKIIFALFVLLFIATSAYPAYKETSKHVKESINGDEMNALKWLKENAISDATIFAVPEDGNLISAISERKNAIDADFLTVKNSNQKYDDVQRLFTTKSYTEAVEIMEKYGAKYLYFSKNARKLFGIEHLEFTAQKCFLEIASGDAKIYERVCRVRIYAV